jgi:RNA-directed DNA polymerase
VKSNGSASDNRYVPGVASPRDESATGKRDVPESISNSALLDQVLERTNLQRALKQVRQNQGAPGIDGMTVDELPSYLRAHWLEIRAQLEAGRYCPQPVRRVEIPKDNGNGVRLLGVPTVLDRFIQQAIAQVVSAQWEPHFHPKSYGFRPQRSAHEAVRQLQADIRDGYRWVVDLDLEAFFDRVNHDRLMSKLKQHVPEAALLRLINCFLKAGVQVGDHTEATTMGVPQGGPLSPVLSNVVLDELDWELERRGHRFARYADDCVPRTRDLKSGECDAAREMREGPSKPACRSRLQTTLSCWGQESWW